MHKKKHPKELYILAFAELCERFAFWGIGNQLVLFLVQAHHFSTVHATQVYGIFVGFSAALPFLGGILADKWNYRHPLIIGAVLNSLSCFLLALQIEWLMYFSLALVAIGYGLFTPSILTVLGCCYHEKPKLREAGFSIYYASINVGVFLALVSLGYVAEYFNWAASFALAGVVQLVGLVPIFYYFANFSKHEQYHPQALIKKEPHPPLTKREKNRLIVILTLTAFTFLFWVPYAQSTSSMSLFALDFIDRTIGSFAVPPQWILASESMFLIILAPIIAKLYPMLQKKHMDPSPSSKTALSLLSLALCFGVMMASSFAIPDGAKHAMINPFYMIFAYFLMAVGEMLAAPVGLSMVSELAPRRYTARLVGFWYVFVGISFYAGGSLAGLFSAIHSLFDFFTIFFVMAGIGAILLFIISKKLTRLAKKEV